MAHDSVHCEKIGSIFHLADQLQLMEELFAHHVGNPLRIERRRPLPGIFLQGLLRGQLGIFPFLRILIFQLVQRKPAALHDIERAGKGLRVAREQAVHFLWRLEVAVGVAFTQEAGIVDDDVVADAGDDVLQHAPGGFVVEHVVGDDRGHAVLRGEVGKIEEAQLVVRPAAERQGKVATARKRFREAAQVKGRDVVRLVGDQHGEQTFAPFDDILPVEMAFSLAGPRLADRQQAAEAGIGFAISRIDDERHAIHEIEAAADDEAHLGSILRKLFRGLEGLHDAGQAVAVDHGHGLDAERTGLGKQFRTAARPAQEREMRGNLEFGVARRHAKIPCRNQRPAPVMICCSSPERNSQKRSPSVSSTWK